MLDARQLFDRFGPGYRRVEPLVLATLLWFLVKFVRYAFPPLFEPLGESYGVSNAVLGVVFTAFMLAYAGMQFPSGALADRFDSATVIASGALLAALGSFSLAIDASFALVAGGMLVVGVGTGVHKTVSVRLLSNVYPERTGRALGVLDTVGTFGGVAAPAAVVLVTGLSLSIVSGWRLLFLATGVIGLVLAAAVFGRLRERRANRTGNAGDAADGNSSDNTTDRDPNSNTTDRDPNDNAADRTAQGDEGIDLREYVALFRRPRFSAFVLVTILFGFAYTGAFAFLPLYLADAGELTSTWANLLYSALFAASVVQLVTGDASDRIGSLPVLFGLLALATAALVAIVVLAGTGSLVGFAIAVVCLGIGAHGVRPVRAVYLLSLVPGAVAGGTLGVVRTLIMTAGALAPAIVGILSEVVGFRPAFGVLAGSAAVATAIVLGLLLTRPGE